MQKEILIHKLNHVYMAVNVVDVGGERQFLRCLESESWRMLSEQCLRLGANQITLDKVRQEVDSNGTARLLI